MTCDFATTGACRCQACRIARFTRPTPELDAWLRDPATTADPRDMTVAYFRAEVARLTHIIRNLGARIDRDGGHAQEGETIEDTFARLDQTVAEHYAEVARLTEAPEPDTLVFLTEQAERMLIERNRLIEERDARPAITRFHSMFLHGLVRDYCARYGLGGHGALRDELHDHAKGGSDE